MNFINGVLVEKDGGLALEFAAAPAKEGEEPARYQVALPQRKAEAEGIRELHQQRGCHGNPVLRICMTMSSIWRRQPPA